MGQVREGDKNRLCPSCRMEISVLAVKCRFCGESVGRPRDEARNLTIDDLGGETVRHYAPSSSVMEAMEAFRSEYEFKSNPPPDAEPARKSMFGIAGKKKGDPNSGTAEEGLPQLDERSQALASLAMPSGKPTATFKRSRGPSAAQRAVQVAGILIGLVVLYFGGTFAYSYFTAAPVVPDRVNHNPAERILASGGDPKQAVIDAANALAKEQHPKNKEILEQAQLAFAKKIHDLLDAKPWTHQSLRDAARNVNDVFKVDRSGEIRKLHEEVTAETFAYQMSVNQISDDSATFGLSRPSTAATDRSVNVKAGEMIDGRFKVIAIKRDSVQVQDTLRDNRPLTFNLNDTVITSP
ncbi:MAG: hypothetical protein SGI88_21760 [Candidatus Hydrogenedentes bacterium]|nr:hypothetical protein [Candidatus Hydrogenedentota bacterium]